jgi:hypothetical protein
MLTKGAIIVNPVNQHSTVIIVIITTITAFIDGEH